MSTYQSRERAARAALVEVGIDVPAVAHDHLAAVLAAATTTTDALSAFVVGATTTDARLLRLTVADCRSVANVYMRNAREADRT